MRAALPYCFAPILSMFVSVALSFGQNDSEARQLYLLANQPKNVDVLPSVNSRPSENPGVVHLGIRYNLVLTDSSNRATPINANRVLKAGDCFAIDVQSNRSGYLYVLAKQSSGAWIPLLPSPTVHDESNIVDPSHRIRIPKTHCFEIHDPPGTETMFLVLSRDPRDFYELYESTKMQHRGPGETGTQQSSPNQTELLKTAVAKLSARSAADRDLVLKATTTDSANKDEPNGSVYVVSSSNQPRSTITTEIKVTHR